MAIKLAFVVGWFAVLEGLLGISGSAAELSIDLSASDAAQQWTCLDETAAIQGGDHKSMSLDSD